LSILAGKKLKSLEEKKKKKKKKKTS